MSALDDNTCDEVALRLSGIIAVFDMLVDAVSGERKGGQAATLLDFSHYISGELQSIYEKISGVDYRG